MFTQASEQGNPCSEPHTHHSPCSVGCKKLYCSLFQLPQRPFCVFCCFPLLQSCTQPIFLLIFLLLWCPASQFGLFAGCSRAQIPASHRKTRLQSTGTHCRSSPGQGQCSSEQTLTSLPAEQSEPQAGELHSSAFSQCHCNSHAPVLLYSHLEKKTKQNQKTNQSTTCPLPTLKIKGRDHKMCNTFICCQNIVLNSLHWKERSLFIPR